MNIFKFFKKQKSDLNFINSKDYWIKRYSIGGNSGPGSYEKFARFKAEVLNEFVENNSIDSIIEYGCGDGNQIKLARYPKYLGFDISTKAIRICKNTFKNDYTKTFKLSENYSSECAKLTLSLDVIYHLIEDEVFELYMRRLFDSSKRFVIIYSSNSRDDIHIPVPHVKHRVFTEWVEKNCKNWKLIQKIPNIYPFKGNPKEGTFSDFYIYEKNI